MCLDHVASGSDSHSGGTQGMYYDNNRSSSYDSNSRNVSYSDSSSNGSYGSNVSY